MRVVKIQVNKAQSNLAISNFWVDINCSFMPKVPLPYPHEVNGKLVKGNGFLIPICSLSNRSLLPSLTVSLIYCNLYERKSKLLSLQSERSAYLSNCKKNYWIAIFSPFHIWQEKNPSVSCTLRYLGIQYLTFYWILIQEKRLGDTK